MPRPLRPMADRLEFLSQHFAISPADCERFGVDLELLEKWIAALEKCVVDKLLSKGGLAGLAEALRGWAEK